MPRELLASVIATAFALLGLAIMAVYGTHFVRVAVVGAAMMCCAAHFAIQDPRRWTQAVANVLNYLGFLVALLALVRFAVT